MSELKKYTRLGSNSRQLAALLQARAPKGHMLAYINPQEAALLKAHGGSGREHEDTGIPSYEDGSEMSYGIDAGDQIPYTQEQVGDLYPGGEAPVSSLPTISPDTMTYGAEGYGGPAMPEVGGVQTPGIPAGVPQFGRTELSGEGISPEFKPAPFMGTETGGGLKALEQALTKYPGLTKAGTTGLSALLGARQARAAGEQGQAAKAEMQQLASPYQRAGAEMQGKAQRGELLPVAQQSMQAAQAQVAQDIQRRGGVGAQQAANQLANLRQQLLQQQYDYGLKLSGIGDQIAVGAIRTGIQADQYANQLTSSYYNNILRSIYGAPGQQQQQQTVTPGAQ